MAWSSRCGSQYLVLSSLEAWLFLVFVNPEIESENSVGYISETSIANVIVQIDGNWYTPPVECGLLAGTYRERLLVQGKVAERKIRKEEIAPMTRLMLVNSIRGECFGYLNWLRRSAGNVSRQIHRKVFSHAEVIGRCHGQKPRFLGIWNI